jgi:hypothetical protein
MNMETVTVKQIHSAFDREADTLLVMPEDKFPKKEEIAEKAERLKKLGFDRCSEINQFERFDKNREIHLKLIEEQRMAHELAKKYRAKYPDIKFIVQKQLDEICKKYGFVTKPVSEYVGDVPEQKLFEMEYWLEEIEDTDIPDCIFDYILTVYDEDIDIKIKRDIEIHRKSVEEAIIKGYHYPYYFPRNYSTLRKHSCKGKRPLSESELIKVFEGKGVPGEDILMSNIQTKQTPDTSLVIAAPASMFRPSPRRT